MPRLTDAWIGRPDLAENSVLMSMCRPCENGDRPA